MALKYKMTFSFPVKLVLLNQQIDSFLVRLEAVAGSNLIINLIRALIVVLVLSLAFTQSGQHHERSNSNYNKPIKSETAELFELLP